RKKYEALLQWAILPTSSLSYIAVRNSASIVGIVKFRMFNQKYEFSINHGDGVDCEAPIETEWLHEVGPFWERLTGYTTNTFEGNLASMIYNPTIR
ncbi:hypothetical protein L195_g033904, partial [Trifolium pratense]